jgi:ubiquinone/menaquinone biosynthesis C-methylase UbiE
MESKAARNAVAPFGTARHPKEVIAEYWDLRSHSYAKGVTASGKEEREVWKRCLAPFTAKLHIRRALDVGAGAGFLSFVLNDMGIDVTGMDLSRGMLSQAKEASCYQRLDLDLCQGDAESLPFQSSSFDLVVSRHLLWTLPDPARAVEEWMRILRPGGRILAIDGNWFDPSAKKKLARKLSALLTSFSSDRNPVPFQKFYQPIEKHLPLYQDAKPDRCQALFESAGLEGVAFDRLLEVNRFYKRYTNLSFRLANADAVFLVKGEKSARPLR